MKAIGVQVRRLPLMRKLAVNNGESLGFSKQVGWVE